MSFRIGSVTADDFDSKVALHYSGKHPVANSLLIDFADASYIDITVLVNFISLFIRRREKQQTTYLGIPKDKKVRDFLRIWRFPEAFYDATTTRFVDILVEEDQQYRGEPPTTYTGLGRGLNALTFDRDWRPGSQGKRNFFEFTSYKLGPHQQSIFGSPAGLLPRLEAERWNNTLIKQILGKYLLQEGEADDVARVVIYESISNAVRHPRASIMLTTSVFQSAKRTVLDVLTQKDSQHMEKESNGHLRILIWDDGESIADTLSPLVRGKKPVRAYWMDPFMYDKIFLQMRDYKQRRVREMTVDQKKDPPFDAPEELILLSSLFPGVSRSVSEHVEDVEPYEADSKKNLVSWAYRQGVGLYALTKTALDSYQGSLLIRSGDHRLLIEPAHDTIRVKKKVRYKAKITRYPTKFPTFKGNLLVIQLPIYFSD
jgi:hypothetical protein